jgi:hypothetical protein
VLEVRRRKGTFPGPMRAVLARVMRTVMARMVGAIVDPRMMAKRPTKTGLAAVSVLLEGRWAALTAATPTPPCMKTRMHLSVSNCWG